MPYYCTVPRCTSMAGKAKNVSFHQFPRDEELASLWNNILKRGKPYTKYSKVCSLHFTLEDYTITSVGKNKGQWRTLRKDAVPSRNLPSDSPTPQHRRRSSGTWCQPNLPSLMDPIIQQQMAQAIYMQTMMAMQAAGAGEASCNETQPPDHELPNTSAPSISDIEQLILKHHQLAPPVQDGTIQAASTAYEDRIKHFPDTFKCEECSKCFKDPDVFVIHQRGHKKKEGVSDSGHEKENFDSNSLESFRHTTLNSNPILANLLKPDLTDNSSSNNSVSSSIENQVIAALTANMEAYIKNFTSLMAQQDVGKDESESESEDGRLSIDENRSDLVENGKMVENNGNTDFEGAVETNCKVEIRDSMVETDCNSSNVVEINNDEDNQEAPDCDIQDLTLTKDSNNLAVTV